MAYADSASDLPMLEAVGFPVAVNPEAKLAAIARRRGWHVEHWRRPPGTAPPPLPLGPVDRRGASRSRTEQAAASPARHCGSRGAWADEGARARAECAPLRRVPGGLAARFRPGRRDRPAPAPRRRPPRAARATGWFRLRPLLSGICGSDLATVDGRSSRYFEDLVSFPFVPGHEVTGVLDDGGVDHAGLPSHPVPGRSSNRCSGVPPRHRTALPPLPDGHTGLCGNVTFGDLSPGLQTGFCTDTGGGWSTAALVAHASQLHAVPEEFSDEDAVIVEPTACAVHAALFGRSA